MKNFAIVSNVVLLAAVAVLFYLQFSKNGTERKDVPVQRDSTGAVRPFTIAYFEMDSVEAKYEMVKDALAQLRTKETAIARELGGLEGKYQNRLAELNKLGPSMSQSEGEAAQRELFNMQQNYQNRKQSLEQDFFNQNEKLRANIKKEIEGFLSEYNKSRQFSYIMANEPGLLYYKDTTYNITEDVVNGLNARYKKKDAQ
jgi:outer membrane protein